MAKKEWGRHLVKRFGSSGAGVEFYLNGPKDDTYTLHARQNSGLQRIGIVYMFFDQDAPADVPIGEEWELAFEPSGLSVLSYSVSFITYLAEYLKYVEKEYPNYYRDHLSKS